MTTIYIDMDDVICDFQNAYNHCRTKLPNIDFPQSIPGFFEGLAAKDGALSAVNQLRNDSNNDVYILTAPSTRNPLSYTEKRIWVENHFDYEFTHQLIICSNKGLLKGDLLIDDYTQGKGQEDFEGTLLNFGSDKYPDWDSILRYIEMHYSPT